MKVYYIWTRMKWVILTRREKYDTMDAWIDNWDFGIRTGARKLGRTQNFYALPSGTWTTARRHINAYLYFFSILYYASLGV